MIAPDFVRDVVHDEDAPLLPRARTQSPRVVFVLGLYRSGANVLYETLRRVLPVAALRIYDHVFYPRLLHNHVRKRDAVDQGALDAYFTALGMTKLPIDGVPISHATLEGYGHLLARALGSPVFSERAAPLLREITQKLRFVQDDAHAVILRNPFDFAQGEALLASFPDAMILYVHRDPVEILSSQLKNAVLLGTDGDPFQELLLVGSSEKLRRLRLHRLLYRLVGARLYRRFFLWKLTRALRRGLADYAASIEKVPKARRMHVEYAELVERPQATLQAIARFVGLEVDPCIEDERPEALRVVLLDEVRARERTLRARLERPARVE